MKTEEQGRKQNVEVEPPPGLATRTCANIWATIDSEEQESTIRSSTFMNSAFYSPESILPPSFLLQGPEPEETESATSETTRSKISRFANIVDEDDPPRSSRVGLIASISVGIIIAFLLFPVIRLVERTTRSHVAEGWTTAISQRLWQYEQIHGTPIAIPIANNPSPVAGVGEILPINLALSGWQQLPSTFFAPSPSLLFREEEAVISSGEGKETFVNVDDMTVWEAGYARPHMADSEPRLGFIYHGDDVDFDQMFRNHFRNTLLVMPGQEVVRSAFGQKILFRESRVFTRVLPSTEPPRN